VSVSVSVSVPERQKSVAVAVDRRNVKRASSPVILFLTERSFERREKEILTQRPLSNAVKDCGLRISDCGMEARAVATVLMLKLTLSLTLTLTLTTDTEKTLRTGDQLFRPCLTTHPRNSTVRNQS
jgi:hypothetical protein